MAKNTQKTNTTNVTAKVANNAPSYTVDDAIRDAMHGEKIKGRAESGIVVALFNDEQWNKQAVLHYFSRPQTQTVVKADGTKGRDKNIITRAALANQFLLRNDHYKTALEKVNACKSALETENKKKAKNAAKITELTLERDNLQKPVQAAQNMFGRALASLYQLRTDGYVTVKHGSHNELVYTREVTKEDGTKVIEDGVHTVSNLRNAGTEALKKAQFVKSRGARTGKPLDTAKISIDNSKPVIAALGKVLESEAFKPPVDSDSETVTTKNDLAELALRCVRFIKKADMKDAELRGTVSQIALPIMASLEVRNINELEKIVKQAANGG